MRLAFMGTPAFAATALSMLLAGGWDVAAVYTRAPKPAGRGHRLTPSPVQAIADAHGIEVRTPNNFRRPETIKALRALDLDAAIVVAYGLILPREALNAPRLGAFNLHASLLPRWRGAAPVQRAIMAGDTLTGVQVMQMEEGLDTGPILLSETVEIRPDDTAGSLHDRLAIVGADLLPRFLSALSRDAISPTPQPEAGVTYAAKISSDEARIDWRQGGATVDAHIRGLSPFPGAWFLAPSGERAVRVKALMSRPAAGSEAGASGDAGIILRTDERLFVGCGEGAVELLRLQREGRAAQDASDFLRGFPLSPGARLD